MPPVVTFCSWMTSVFMLAPNNPVIGSVTLSVQVVQVVGGKPDGAADVVVVEARPRRGITACHRVVGQHARNQLQVTLVRTASGQRFGQSQRMSCPVVALLTSTSGVTLAETVTCSSTPGSARLVRIVVTYVTRTSCCSRTCSLKPWREIFTT